jgi:hypothetical protein
MAQYRRSGGPIPTWQRDSPDAPSSVPTRPRSSTPSGAAPLGTWLRELVRPSTPDSEFGDDDYDGPGGSFLCALPPISDPFWRSTDLAEHARTALSTLQRERQLLLAKLKAQRQSLTTRSASALAITAGTGPELKAALAEQAAAAAKREERCAPSGALRPPIPYHPLTFPPQPAEAD